MSILAIDTVGTRSSMAIIDCHCKYFIEYNSAANSHEESFFSVLDTLFDKHNYSYNRIDHLAVVTGPGSFTGIRVGLSATIGIGVTINKPVYGVSILEVQAYAISLLRKNSTENIRSMARNSKKLYTQLFNSNLVPLSEPEVADNHLECTKLPELDASHAGLLVHYRLRNKHRLNDAKALYLSSPKIIL